MRTCGRCGHDNAGHLAYCSSCGRRLLGSGGVPPHAPGPVSTNDAVGAGSSPARESAPTAFAATIAISNPSGASAKTRGSGTHPGVLSTGVDAVRYVFSYVRGRMDAEDRKRKLVDEREGAARLLEGALIELGHLVLTEGPGTPELAGLTEAVVQARERREAAITDLAAAEKFRTSEDVRLGLLEAAAETECNACETGAARVDDLLHQLDDQRREVDAGLGRLRSDNAATNLDLLNEDSAALIARHAHLDEEVGALRERGAALRASTIAARAKLDQAIATRRQTAASVVASIAAHARDHAEAEKQIRDTTTQIGQTTFRRRPALPPFLPAYARIDRLEEAIADRDRQTAGVERIIGHYDLPKLAAGLGLLTGILGVLGIGLWALLHRR